MVKAKKFVVTKHYQGVHKRDDYELVEFELPALKDGEFLVKTEWISVDPYLRTYYISKAVPYDQFGYQVGTVIESKNKDYPTGIKVVSHRGWCDYTIISDANDPSLQLYKLPDLQGLPLELSVGLVGMPGATAYHGFLEICKPKAGETVVVTGAAGAVGSIVGQIARIKGCKVIGFAGSDDKVEWLEKEVGFDKAINYKTADIKKALREAAPNGVDCYFDNVGGEISSVILEQMNSFGRVAVCGCISVYNADPSQLPKATTVQLSVAMKQITIKGFIVFRWFEPGNGWPEAFAHLVHWIKSGQLKIRHHVTDGFDQLFEALVGMLSGDNIGKAVVKV